MDEERIILDLDSKLALVKNFNTAWRLPFEIMVNRTCWIPSKKAISPYVDLSRIASRIGSVNIAIIFPVTCGVIKYNELVRKVLFLDILFRINEII